jgi:hypothetical protein
VYVSTPIQALIELHSYQFLFYPNQVKEGCEPDIKAEEGASNGAKRGKHCDMLAL